MSNLKLVGAVLLLLAIATLGLRHWTRVGAEAVVGEGPFPSQAELDKQAGQTSAQTVYEADEVTPAPRIRVAAGGSEEASPAPR